MEAIFWYGLGLGALLSFVASVLANVFNTRISAFLESTRFLATERSKRRAIRRFKEVRRSKEKGEDIYLYVVAEGTRTIFVLVGGSCVLIGGMLYALVGAHGALQDATLAEILSDAKAR